jgi:hypothetical protein
MRLAGEHGIKAVRNGALTDALHCPDMGVDGDGDFSVTQRTIRTVFIGKEQHGGGAVPVSPNAAFATEGFELLAFFRSESDAK